MLFLAETPADQVKVAARKRGRIHYQWFPLWQRDEDLGRSSTTGRACLDLMRRDSLRCNLHFAVYEQGKYPHYRKDHLVTEGTIRIPLPVIKHLAAEIRRAGVQVRKRGEHKWRVFRFKEGVKG